MEIRYLGERIYIYNDNNRLVSAFILVEARVELECGQLLTWNRKFRAKPCDESQKICGAVLRNMKKGERDLVRFYGPIDIKVKT